jgi:hypothetical protein
MKSIFNMEYVCRLSAQRLVPYTFPFRNTKNFWAAHPYLRGSRQFDHTFTTWTFAHKHKSLTKIPVRKHNKTVYHLLTACRDFFLFCTVLWYKIFHRYKKIRCTIVPLVVVLHSFAKVSCSSRTYLELSVNRMLEKVSCLRGRKQELDKYC